eukprot:GHRR01001289.1.p1 GENE.GHRR01001289.1~~GHRR01001289.1.p1  ORF type:complete len:108 (+),score=23.08 GHRR01001289.1:98-421(+)
MSSAFEGCVGCSSIVSHRLLSATACTLAELAIMGIAPYFGFFVGIGITCFKNGLQYKPAYRQPWEHLIAGFGTAYAFDWIVKQEDWMVKQIEEHYAKYGGQTQGQSK